MKNIALILLGGSGKRFGGDTPKQFLKRNGIPIYIEAIRKFEDIESIDAILLVSHKDYIDEVKEDIVKYQLHKIIDVIAGGKERFISSYLGLKYLSTRYDKNDNVLIADAVRPNTSRIIILANIFALVDNKAVLTAIRGDNKGERIDTSHVINGVNFLAQTPQSFKLGYIYDLYEEYISIDDFFPFDDINVVEMKKDKYVVVEGEIDNYKITRKEDFERYMNNK